MKSVVLIFIFATLDASARVLSFDEALNEMTEKHSTVLIQKTKVDQAETGASKAKLNMLPHFSFSAGQNTTPGGSTATTNSLALNGSVNLFRAGSDFANIHAANADRESAEATFVNTLISAESESASALITFIEKQQKIEILKKNVSIFQTSLTIANQRYKKGLFPLQEADKASVDLGNSLARLSDAETEVTGARASVERLLGDAQVEKNWPWKTKLRDAKTSRLMKTDFSEPQLNARPDYRAAVALLQAERERSVSAHRLVFPSLDLGASYGVGGVGSFIVGNWNAGNTTSIVLTLPFFDALQNQSSYRIQVQSESAAEIKVKQLERDIRALAKSAQQSLAIAVDTALMREHTLETSRRLYETNMRRLQQGRASANEVALDQQRLTDSELLDLQGWASAHLAYVNLCHAFGQRVRDCSTF